MLRVCSAVVLLAVSQVFGQAPVDADEPGSIVTVATRKGEVNRALDTFTTARFWASYDPGANGVGADPDGYNGAVLVGRYVYFVPYDNGTECHGEVLRYDLEGAFDDVSSWATFDAGANGVGADPDGYVGAVFDGRYVYFVPHYNGTEYHGEVLRYDTQGTFADVSSWATYDPGANGVGMDPDGYWDGAFDGRYIYFAPYENGSGVHGEVLRYDTQDVFDDVSSWATFDLVASGVGEHAYGYRGAVYDGQYVFFAPSDGSEVARYDTEGAFSSVSSWATNDVGANGYAGGVLVGSCIYFVPWTDGEVLRYDTQGPFGSTSSWTTFDPSANGVGTYPGRYIRAVSDWRYIYFAPWINVEVLRYDTQGAFDDTAAWTTFDPGAHGIGTGVEGFSGGVFDGRYVYIVPVGPGGPARHGEVLRYDTLHVNGQPIPAVSTWGLGVLMLLMLGAGAAMITRRQRVAAS